MRQNSITDFNPTQGITHHYQRFVKYCLAIFLLSLSLMITDIANASEESVQLKLAHVGTVEGAIGRGGDRFAENLTKVSDGNMTAKVVPKAVLGNIREIWAQMKAGTIDMQVIDLPAISMLKPAKSMQVVIMPYLFESQEHFRKFADSELHAEMAEEITNETGIRYLGIVEDRSPRIVSTTGRIVKSVDDVAGMKIRTPGHPMYMKVFKSWGAAPTPIPGPDMFMALKTGVVEGEDNGIVNLIGTANREVIKNVTPINWNRSGVAAWIAESRWKQLSDQQREWVSEAIEISERDSKLAYEENMQEARLKLKQLGIVTQEADVDSFKQSSKDFHLQFKDLWPEGTVEKIKAMAK